MLRTFLALDLPVGLQPLLEQVMAELRRCDAEVRWVPVGNVHLTLKFFGEVSEVQVEEIARAAAAVARSRAPFRLRLAGAGAFPTPRSPRVVWVGVAGELEPLRELHQQLEAAFEALGFPREDRPFTPHLTVGRVKSSKGRDGLVRCLAGLPPFESEPFEVREIILYRSKLSPQGATYLPLRVISLG